MARIQRVVICLILLLFGSFTFAQRDAEVISVDNVDQIILLQTFRGHIGAVNGVAFSPDGDLIASVGDDATLRLWDVLSGQQITETYEHFSFVKDVDFNSKVEDMLATASWDRSVLIWDISGEIPTVSRLIQGGNAIVENAVFSPDGEFLAYGVGNGTLNVLALEDDEVVQTFNLPALQITDIAISPDSNHIAAAGGFPDDTAYVWDIDSGELQFALTGHLGAVTTVRFHPDREMIATGGDDGTVRLWSDGEEIAMFVEEDWIVELAFHPNGSLLAVALQNGFIQFWDVENLELVTTLEAHRGLVNALAFNTEGNLLASVGDDGLVKLWGLPE